jgi:hypothetical protein
VQVAALGRSQHAGTGAVVALVGQRGQPQQGGRGVQRAEETGAAVRSWVDPGCTSETATGNPSGSQTTCTLPP